MEVDQLAEGELMPRAVDVVAAEQTDTGIDPERGDARINGLPPAPLHV